MARRHGPRRPTTRAISARTSSSRRFAPARTSSRSSRTRRRRWRASSERANKTVSASAPANGRKWGEAGYAGALLLVGLLGVGGGLKYGLVRDDGIMGPGFIPLLGG